MTGISSYSSQLTPVCLLHTEKKANTILPFVSNMAFPTSPLSQHNLTMLPRLKRARPGRNICRSPCKHQSSQVLTVGARHTVNTFFFHTWFPNQNYACNFVTKLIQIRLNITFNDACVDYLSVIESRILLFEIDYESSIHSRC